MLGFNKAAFVLALALVALSLQATSAQSLGAYGNGAYSGRYGGYVAYAGGYYPGGYMIPSPSPSLSSSPAPSTNGTAVNINNGTEALIKLNNQLKNAVGMNYGTPFAGIAIAAALSAVFQMFL